MADIALLNPRFEISYWGSRIRHAASRQVLRDVVAGREEHGYPLMFATEASIDLADDAELMQLMVDANICRLSRERR